MPTEENLTPATVPMRTEAKSYIGTKRIEAWPEPRLGIEGNEPGYAILYPDGYKSWSPKAVFEEAYQLITGMSFGHALVMLQAGHRVARRGWNGKDMWLILVPGSTGILPGKDTPYGKAGLEKVDINPHIDMMTATGQMQPGWLASQSDMLANDWTVVI